VRLSKVRGWMRTGSDGSPVWIFGCWNILGLCGLVLDVRARFLVSGLSRHFSHLPSRSTRFARLGIPLIPTRTQLNALLSPPCSTLHTITIPGFGTKKLRFTAILLPEGLQVIAEDQKAGWMNTATWSLENGRLVRTMEYVKGMWKRRYRVVSERVEGS
jgi:hypothetical protein